MHSVDHFLFTMEALLEFRAKHFPDTNLKKIVPKLHPEGRLKPSVWQDLKAFGIEDIEGTIALFEHLLSLMSAFIGEDLAISYFLGKRFGNDAFKDQIHHLQLEDFIFLERVKHHNLRGIVRLFKVKKRRNRLTTGLKLLFFEIDKRKVIYREGMGCTVTFSRKDRKLLKRQPNMQEFIPSYHVCTKGDLKLDAEVTSTVNQATLDLAIQSIFEKTERQDKGTKAVVVVHRGKVVREVYNNASTPPKYNLSEFRDDVHENTPLLGWSMTKSITNAILGAMIQQGFFGDYDQFYTQHKATNRTDASVIEQFLQSLRPKDYLPFLSTSDHERWREINMNDLLHMSSGLVWAEDKLPYDVFQMIYRERDMAKYAATKGVEFPPAFNWKYSSGTANIIAGVMQACFQQQKGGEALKDYWEFPHRFLFRPLGMCNTTLQADIKGTLVGSSYCIASARDWARFGLLFMNDGIVQKTQERILPKGWVAYTASPALSDDGKNIAGGIYGAQFWLNQASVKDTNDANKHTGYEGVPDDMFYARGLFGQRVFIIPSMELVVVRMGARDSVGLKQFIKEVVKAFV